MKTTLNITVPMDFELLCVLTSTNIENVIQDYINRISLPKQMSIHPDDPLGTVVNFFLQTAHTNDPEEVLNTLEKLLANGYEKELENIIKIDSEQPECEELLREVINNWTIKVGALREELKRNGLKFKICHYGN